MFLDFIHEAFGHEPSEIIDCIISFPQAVTFWLVLLAVAVLFLSVFNKKKNPNHDKNN